MSTERTPENIPDYPNGPAPEGVDGILGLLDPDLQKAYLDGNKFVIQAVQQGYTTTEQIVEAVLRNGGEGGNLPSSITDIVEATRQRLAEKREADEKFQRGLLASAAGMAAWAAGINEARAGENKATASQNPDRAMWQDVSSAQLAKMSFDEWGDLTVGQRQGLMTEAADRLGNYQLERSNLMAKDIEAFHKENLAKGMTQEQSNAKFAGIMGVLNKNGGGFNTPEELAKAKTNIDAIQDPKEREWAEKMYEHLAKMVEAGKERVKVEDAQKPGTSEQDKHRVTTTAYDTHRRLQENLASKQDLQAQLEQEARRSERRAFWQEQGRRYQSGEMSLDEVVKYQTGLMDWQLRDGKYTEEEEARTERRLALHRQLDAAELNQDRLLQQGSTQTDQATKPEVISLMQSRSDIVLQNTEVDSKVAVAEVRRDQADAGASLDDEPANPAVAAAVPQEAAPSAPAASVASAPSITIPGKPPVVGPASPLLAQLGAAPEPEVADPTLATAGPEALRRKPAAGFGASA